MSIFGDRRWRKDYQPRPDVDRDLADEFAFHIAERAAELAASGMDSAAARAQAEREFGDRARAAEDVRRIEREAGPRRRASAAREALALDLRYALRMLRSTPSFTLTAGIILALSIGACTAIFSVVNGVLLRSLPFGEPERLVRLWEISPRGDDRNPVSSGNYHEWRTRARSIGQIGLHQLAFGMTMTGRGEAERVLVSPLSASALALLQVPPAAGRLFNDDDDQAVILSDQWWRSRFGSDPALLGTAIELDGRSYTIVGIMPAGFTFPTAAAQAWRVVPASQPDPNQRRAHNWAVIGRLAPGATIEQANAEIAAIAASLGEQYPEFMKDWSARVAPLHEDLVSDVRPMLLILLGGAVVVLLVACVNIANLLLARALTREREMAVRGALGAGQGRLVRQLLTESLLLATAGGIAGLAGAALLLRWLVAMAPDNLPRLEAVGIEPPVLLFVLAATLTSTVLFGLVPALRLARANLQSTLRSGPDRQGGVRHARLRGALLVFEVALSLVLMAGAGLLLRSAGRLARVDVGYDTRQLLIIGLELPSARYDSTRDAAFFAELLPRIAGLPGVRAAGSSSEPPALGFDMTFGFAIAGRLADNPSGREEPVPVRVVTPEYFTATGIPLRQGRLIEARDRGDAPLVVLIDEGLARRHFPEGNAVGSLLSFTGQEGPWVEIAGVVGATRIGGVDAPPAPAIYVPLAQKAWNWMKWQTLFIRLNDGADPGRVAAAVRQTVREMDPGLALLSVATADELYAASVARQRFATSLLSGFALVGLLLGAIGMYGVVSYTVEQRRREFGIRRALGARDRTIQRELISQTLTLTLAGVIAGGALSLLLTRLLSGLLYETSPMDLPTYAVVVATMTLVALLAAWLPARRIARIDPLEVMRS